MERRLILVFVLTFIVILLSQPLLKKYLPQPAQPQKQAEPQPQQASQQASPAPATPVLTSTKPAANTNPQAKQAAGEADTVIENSLYRITFTNRGAQVKSWVLKKFDDDRGRPLELVNSAASAKYGYPLSLWTYDQGQRTKINSALFVASKTGAVSAPAEVTFEYADGGLSVRKVVRFDDTYVVHIETSATVNGGALEVLPVWPAGFGDQASAASYHNTHIEYQIDNKVERLDVKKISGGATLKMNFNWAGVADQYFAAVFLPEDPSNTVMVTLRNALDIPKDPEKPNPQETTQTDVLGAAVGNPSGPTMQRMYVGPKSLQALEAVKVPTIRNDNQDLRALVNFGFFNVIARPLFLWLKWTYNHLASNWGWAIAIQTLIINLALLPLRISSMKSALKMQKIQPQMNAIKEKYKKYSMRDPRRQEMNQEIAALMKQESVSPVGGCLPLVIQMPFLFAYYSMLGAAIELRHAHWLWVHDLSAPDPWHILPIGIIITMLFTQRMTPQAGMDPSQQKMMNLMMPLMLGVISWNLAAGLCLYWSEGNLIAIVQQAVMNRTQLGREMREMQLKRARKKDKS